MFTGIVEEMGSIKQIAQKGNTLSLSIYAKKIMPDLKVGDSISVNGVCLTVTNFMDDFFRVDVMPETFKATSLSTIKEGTKVNLERAMSANGRFGGHFVTGHVDGVGKILRKTPKENAIYYDIQISDQYRHLSLHKGSIAIDGISLTLFDVSSSHITVSLIPHSANETVLGYKKAGDFVNLEFDMIAKYLYRFYQIGDDKTSAIQGIDQDFLKQNGFM
jgi:riboflavin synthase